MAPYKTGQLGNEAESKRSAKVGFVGTKHQLGINAWRERPPLSWEKSQQQEGAVPVQPPRRAVGSLLRQPQPRRDHYCRSELCSICVILKPLPPEQSPGTSSIV